MKTKNYSANHVALISALVFLAVAPACGQNSTDHSKTRSQAGGTAGNDFEELDLAVCAPGSGAFSADVDHPYFPLPVGRKLVLEGDEDGTKVRVELTVLKNTKNIDGVSTRVVEEQEFENGGLVEISRNYYAQASDGTVCYFGEDVQEFENGAVTGTAGSWRAGDGDSRPGIFIPAEPRPNTQFSQEVAPGIAEDKSAILAVGQISVPGLEFDGAVHVVDWNPLKGQTREDGDQKFYAKGVGLVVDGAAKLVSGAPDGETPDGETPDGETPSI